MSNKNVFRVFICSNSLQWYFSDEDIQLREGDSGGPLLQDMNVNFEQRWGVSGIVSIRVTVESCQDPHTVFTKVAAFKDWITSIVNGES